MKLSEYGFILENYCMSIRENKIQTLNFVEYDDEKICHEISIHARKDGTYLRKDLITDKSSLPERIETIQRTPSVSPIALFNNYGSEVKKYTYQTASDKNANSFFISLPGGGNERTVRKAEISKDGTAFYDQKLSMIQVYHENEDGELDFNGEHDTIYIYPNFLVADCCNVTDGVRTRTILRNGEKEEFIIGDSFAPIRHGLCNAVITKDRQYQVKYNFYGLVTEVTSCDDSEKNLFSRYEMIDEEKYHIAHSIYPYLGESQQKLHIFPFRDIWVHDEVSFGINGIETLDRNLFAIRDEDKLLHELRNNQLEPIIEMED